MPWETRAELPAHLSSRPGYPEADGILSPEGDGTDNERDPAEPTPRRRWALPFLVGALGAVIGSLVVLGLFDRTEPLSQEQIEDLISEQAEPSNGETDQPEAATLAFQAAVPSVVQIATGDGTSSTGVIIDNQGMIMTTRHTLTDADAIDITFADGTIAQATIADEVPERDLAILEPDGLPQVLVPAVFGSTPEVGQTVYVVGHPYGLSVSIAEAIVSGLGRSLPISDTETIDELIQFDAPVSTGTSGAPLVNAEGNVVGIVTGLPRPAGSNELAGLGFAISLDVVAAAGGGNQ